MQIEFSKAEADLMDEALKTWSQAPIQEGFSGAVMGAFLKRATGASDEDFKKETKDEIAEARMKALSRERKTLFLRAKIAQAMARDSEHVV